MSNEDLLSEFFCRLFCRQKRETLIRFGLSVDGFTISFLGVFNMILPDDKTVGATVAFVDAKGKPAKVDGAPVWTSDNDAVASVVASDDGLSATVTPGDIGTAQISVTADADLGAGFTSLVGIGTVEVVAGTAVTATVSFGEPA